MRTPGSGRLAGPREVRGWLHIGCLFSFAPCLLPQLLREYQRGLVANGLRLTSPRG